MNKSSKTKITPIGDNYYMRENPKKFGEFQYKKKYRYKDTEGYTHHTETRWCPSKEIALREATEQQRNNGLKNHSNGTVGELFLKYIETLKKITSKERKTTHKLSTSINERESACGLYNNQTPEYIKNTFIKDFNSQQLSKWLKHIDNGENLEMELSYNSVKRKILIVSKFISYLKQYLPESHITELNNTIINHKYETKKDFGKRHDRVELQNSHLIALFNHYLGGEYSFNNYYWYTLYLTLFCTGMRVGELVALQWKDVQLDEDPANSVIYINKSIHEKEFPEHAIATIKAGNGTPKNKYSKREINIFTANRNALIIYKKLCFYHYYLECGYKTIDDMEDDFVFRNFRSRNNPQYYQTHKTILKELKNASAKIGIPASDAQMFRHATCRFLVKDCGHLKENVYTYFGHSSIDMIENVYSSLSPEDQRIRTSRTIVDFLGTDTVERIKRVTDKTMINYLNHDISKNRDNRFYMIHNLFLFHEIVLSSYKANKCKNIYILSCDRKIYSRMCEIRELSIKDLQNDIDDIKQNASEEDAKELIEAISENKTRTNEIVFELDIINENPQKEWPIYYNDFNGLNEPIDIKNLKAIDFVMKNKKIKRSKI